jgi:hypothetical protein
MSFPIARRVLLTGAAASATLSCMPKLALSAVSANGPLSEAGAFLRTLNQDSLSEARFEFGGQTHRYWNFMGTSVKPGLLIERMSEDQKNAADRMLRSLLSASGYDKMRLVMETQNVMRDLGRPPSSRNSERFSVAVFGEPSEEKLWGVRIEGHHLSLNWTLRGNGIVSVTPSSFSVIPQNVPIGKLKGKVVLEAEESLARRLVNDLAGSKQQQAVIAGRAPGNVRALAGSEDRFGQKQGLAAADMLAAQQDLLWELIETTAVAPWPGAVAEAQRKRIREGDPSAVHLAWEGGLRRGEMFYYRIHGDTFTLELATVLGDPEHLHASFQDPDRTFGKHVT